MLQIIFIESSVQNCCLSPSPKPVDFMGNQQLKNVTGPLDQQSFIITKLQYTYSLLFSVIHRILYKIIL